MRIKVLKNNRLVYYQAQPDKDFWDDYWDKTISGSYYKKYDNGELDEYTDIFEPYLQKTDRILEAGCGNGRYIIALLAKGFVNIEGIEWGTETVKKVKSVFPNIPINSGDVTQIPKPDKFYDAYISLGVMEHNVDGPAPFLIEANRVLKSGGIALITVPNFNFIRRIKSILGYYSRPCENLPFYQYAFTIPEFKKILLIMVSKLLHLLELQVILEFPKKCLVS